MRTRVACFATLLTLLILGFLLTRGCSQIADEKNSLYRDNLYSSCLMLGTTLDTQSVESRVQSVMSADNSDQDVSYSLYKADGTKLFSTEEYAVPVSTEEEQTEAGKTVTYDRNNAEGKQTIYAIYQLDDGDFLMLSRLKTSAWAEFSGRGSMIGTAILMLMAMVYCIVSAFKVKHVSTLDDHVMNALDGFGDGKFEARVQDVPSMQDRVNNYNGTLDRIQARMQRLSTQNRAVNTVLTQMQNGIIAVDQNLNVLLITPVAKKLLGIIGNAEGKPISEASRNVRLDDVFRESMQQGGVYTNEVAAKMTEGRGHIPLRLYVSPMRNEDEVVGALAMVEDITEIRRLERVRTDFAANVSHELKTPLTSIRGFVETLEEGAIDNPPMAHKFLKIIIMETERLTRLINDILSISKLESGDDEVEKKILQLDKMAYDVADMLSIHAGEKEVTVDCHLNKTPVYVYGNSDRVEQMLINLIENAIKYNKPGGSVTVQVFINGGDANVAISDTGIGIAEENLPRLFERFYRVDKGRSRQMGGTGLGLAIVKHIVKSMSGEIEVHSKLGEGTEFLVTLPLATEVPKKDTIFDEEEQPE